MAPGRKPVQRVRRNPQSQHTGKAQRRAGKSNGANAAGTQIGNDQERAEENHGGSKVIHQCQKAADYNGVGNEQNQISFVHDPVHGGCAGIDKADLTELRRLQRKAANHQPVLGTVVLLAEKQCDNQEPHPRQHRKITEPLCAFQIPQRPANQQKHSDAHQHSSGLLQHLPRLNGGKGRDSQRTQKEGDGFHLKGTAAYHRIEQEQRPLTQEYRTKAQKVSRIFRNLTGKQKTRQHQRLHQSQQHQPQKTAPAAGASGPQLALQLLLPFGNRGQLHIHTANGNHISAVQGTDTDPFSIDPGSGFGTGIGNGPASVIVPGEHRMVPRYR